MAMYSSSEAIAKMSIQASVIIITKNAGSTIAATLDSVRDFSEVIVVDSFSDDQTKSIALAKNIPVIDFAWNGQYPKKRQWVLENVPVKNKWIFFVDGDEIITPELAQEIWKELQQPQHDAYFVQGQPVFGGQVLKHGRWNNKIVLFKKTAISYPEFPDLDISGMGEVEGHYQPKIIGSVGQIYSPLIHDCAENLDEWIDRHQRYATWQSEVEHRGMDLAVTETGWRALAKRAFQDSFGRAVVMFLDSYILKQGFLDGKAGLDYAVARGWYYWLISAKKSALAGKARGDSASASTLPR
jgi:glycosyltransferase involved in cell wall biosynthesis